MIAFYCLAGQQYGMGHAMRTGAIARALLAQKPDADIAMVGNPFSVRLLRKMFPGKIVTDDLKYVEKSRVLIEDVPHHVNLYHPNGINIAIDMPWVTRASHDHLILPGIHHGAARLARLRYEFGENLHAGGEWTVLPHAPQEIVPWEDRKDIICFVAGGSDPHGMLRQMAHLTFPLRNMLPDVSCVFLQGSAMPASAVEGMGGVLVVPFDFSYLRHARLVVCTWGITAYECLAAGTPVLAVPQNTTVRLDVARAAEVSGFALHDADMLDEYTPAQFSDAIYSIYRSYALDMHCTAQRVRTRDLRIPLPATRDEAQSGAHRIAKMILDIHNAAT